ncbi:MAG: hypothetical protein Q8Q09_16460 [Deltaproteobacteria bacterium]|nr:hypothetical protein [Deltaproteobacteria bacterium]
MDTAPSLLAQWHPVTCDYGLIEAPLDAVAEGFARWQRSLGRTLQERTMDSGFADVLAALLPLSMGKRRCALVQTDSPWTAVLQSGTQGSDPTPIVRVLSQCMGTRAMRVCARERATIWELFAPNVQGPVRTVFTVREAKRWRFGQSGQALAHEPTERYALPSVRARFDRGVLAACVGPLGVRPWDDAFFGARAVVVEREARVREPPELTLAEALAALGESFAASR